MEDETSSFQTLFIVEIANLISVFIQGNHASVTQEEGSQIPAIGHIKVELFSCFFRCSQTYPLFFNVSGVFAFAYSPFEDKKRA